MRRLFAALATGVLIYEVVALRNKHSGDTISEVVWGLSKRPLVPFVAGMIAGHFFWQRYDG